MLPSVVPMTLRSRPELLLCRRRADRRGYMLQGIGEPERISMPVLFRKVLRKRCSTLDRTDQESNGSCADEYRK